MTRIRRPITVLTAACVLASTLGAGSTTVLASANVPAAPSGGGASQVVQFGDRYITVPSGHHFYGSHYSAMSGNAQNIVVESGSDLTVPYQAEIIGLGAGTFKLTKAGDIIRLAEFQTVDVVALNSDGTQLIEATSMSLVPADTDGTSDLYVIDALGPHLVTPFVGGSPKFVAMTDDASVVVFSTKTSFDPLDTDTTLDYYRWTRSSGAINLVSPGSLPVTFDELTDDGSRVIFETGENVLNVDLGPSGETVIYQWYQGTVSIRGRGDFVTSRDHGAKIYMNTTVAFDPIDTDTQMDAYVNDATGYRDLSEPSAQFTLIAQVNDDGTKWTLATSEKLLPADTDNFGDFYLVDNGVRSLVTLGSLGSNALLMDASFTSGIYSTRSKLDPADTDDWGDVYRWRAASPETPELLSGTGTPDAGPVAYSPDGTRALISSTGQLLPEDTDPFTDLYEFANGHLALVFPGYWNYDVRGWSPDLKRIVVSSGALTDEDTNGLVDDVYISDVESPPPPPSIVVSARPDPAYYGDQVTLRAILSSLAEGGSVEFFEVGAVGQPDVSIGSATVGPDGVATIFHSFAKNEGLQLRAHFSGTADAPAGSQTYTRHQFVYANVLVTDGPNTWHPSHSATFKFGEANPSLPLDHVACAIDSGPAYVCVSPKTFDSLADGPHVFRVWGTDMNGRTQPSPNEWNFKVDTTGPTFTFNINGGATVTNDPSVTLSISAEDYSSVDTMRSANWDHIAEDGLLDGNGNSQFSSNGGTSLTDPYKGGTPYDGYKTVYVQLGDLLGNWSVIKSQTIVLDTHAPHTVAPTLRIPVGKMGASVPVAITWPMPVDSLTGVASRTRWRAINGGPWVQTQINSDALANGTIGLYSQRSADGAGNATTWIEAPAVKAAILQELNAAIGKNGSWSKKKVAGASGGRVVRSSSVGATATTTFTGTSIGWVSTTGPTFGKARVYVDGNLVTTIDLYAATKQTKRIVWSTSFANPGMHTVKIVVASSPGRQAVDLDAFVELAAPPTH